MSEQDLPTRFSKDRLNDSIAREGEDTHGDSILVIGGQLSVPRKALNDLVKRFHIKKLALFGSAARGELRPESDVDLLVEFDPEEAPSLWTATELQDELSRLFDGRPVDIVPPEVLRNPYRRKTIEQDLKVLHDEAA